jgi:hypothetical protein
LSTAPVPGVDDERARETAIRVERGFPQWMIMWGVYSQEFWAFARFDGPQAVIVHTADPDELARRMLGAEARAAGWHTPD